MLKAQVIVREYDQDTESSSVRDIIEVPIPADAEDLPIMLRDSLNAYILEANETSSNIDSITIEFSRNKQTAESVEIVKGQRWRYDGTSPHLISTHPFYKPMWMYVTIVHDDGENVHYRSDHNLNRVDQTSRDRFLEVASLVPPEDQLEVQKEYSAAESCLINFKLAHRKPTVR